MVCAERAVGPNPRPGGPGSDDTPVDPPDERTAASLYSPPCRGGRTGWAGMLWRVCFTLVTRSGVGIYAGQLSPTYVALTCTRPGGCGTSFVGITRVRVGESCAFRADRLWTAYGLSSAAGRRAFSGGGGSHDRVREPDAGNLLVRFDELCDWERSHEE